MILIIWSHSGGLRSGSISTQGLLPCDTSKSTLGTLHPGKQMSDTRFSWGQHKNKRAGTAKQVYLELSTQQRWQLCSLEEKEQPLSDDVRLKKNRVLGLSYALGLNNCYLMRAEVKAIVLAFQNSTNTSHILTMTILSRAGQHTVCPIFHKFAMVCVRAVVII